MIWVIISAVNFALVGGLIDLLSTAMPKFARVRKEAGM